jgi:hypothetical protein
MKRIADCADYADDKIADCANQGGDKVHVAVAERIICWQDGCKICVIRVICDQRLIRRIQSRCALLFFLPDTEIITQEQAKTS